MEMSYLLGIAGGCLAAVLLLVCLCIYAIRARKCCFKGKPLTFPMFIVLILRMNFNIHSGKRSRNTISTIYFMNKLILEQHGLLNFVY